MALVHAQVEGEAQGAAAGAVVTSLCIAIALGVANIVIWTKRASGIDCGGIDTYVLVMGIIQLSSIPLFFCAIFLGMQGGGSPSPLAQGLRGLNQFIGCGQLGYSIAALVFVANFANKDCSHTDLYKMAMADGIITVASVGLVICCAIVLLIATRR